jgi:hypothetical protein
MWAKLSVLATITSDGWNKRNILHIFKAYHPIHSKLTNRTHVFPSVCIYDMLYPIHSKLRYHTQLCPLLYTNYMIYPIHSKLRDHTQVCLVCDF